MTSPALAPRDPRLLASTLVAAGVVFTVDVLSPAGVSTGILYVFVVWLVAIRGPSRVLAAAAVCSCLTLLGLYLSPPGPYRSAAWINRGLTLVVIWFTAIFRLTRELPAERRADLAQVRYASRLQTIVDHSTVVIYMKDLAGRYLLVNVEWERLFRFSRAHAIGKTDRELFPADMAERLSSNDRAVHESGRAVPFEEQTTRDGQTLVYLSTKFLLRDASGDIYALAGVSQDITKRKAAEDALLLRTRSLEEARTSLERQSQRLKAQAEELARSNRDLEEFASVASHDLQEPLRKILAFGGRLKSTHGRTLSPDGLDHLSRMLDAADRMRHLIDDLLALSRVGRTKREFAQVDLMVVARQVVADLDERISATGARVALAPLPTIEAERSQMHQLLLNLVANALKFQAPDRAPIVRVEGGLTARQTGNDTLTCELIVKDNGIGFHQRYATRVFEPFRRLHERGRYPGTGIGLAICKRIVDRHGGQIGVTSEPGQGSTFFVRLPATRPREAVN